MKVERLKWFLAVLLFGVAAVAGASNAKEEAVTLDTPTGKLAGSMLVPASAGKVPLALIIAGSGPTDRDGNNPLIPGKNDSLKMLAQALADAGVASVRYDKRGIAASAPAGPKEADLRFDMYVDDAVAWIGKLKDDPRFGQVIILGHSEGSFIGMLAAQRTKPAAYVSLAGIADAAQVILRKQLAGKLPPPLAEANERILTDLEHGKTVEDVPPPLAPFYHASIQPYLISWFKYVPARTIAALDMPVLIVQGDNDVQVGVEQAQALKAAQPHATLAIIPGMNHVLKIAPTDPQQNVAAYGNPALPLAPQLVAALNGFLRTAHVTAN